MSDCQEIKFSVIVPAYNVEKYVERSIKSVLEQTYQNFELIIVDDGSVDNTADVCQKYADKDSRIKVIRQKNAGQLAARFTAIKNSTGDYYVFSDSDDYLERDALETIRSTIKKYRCDCVFYNYKLFFEKEGRFSKRDESFPRQRPFVTNDKKEIVSCLFAPRSRFESLCRKAIRASLISKDADYSSFYHIRQGEDALMSLDIYRNLASAAFIDASLYVYCIRTSSSTFTFSIDGMASLLIVYDAEFNFLQNDVGSLFTTDELLRLKTRLLLSFIGRIMFVCTRDRPKNEKRDVLEQMLQSKYFSKAKSDYVRQKKSIPMKQRIVMFLFRRKAFGALITLTNSSWQMKNFVKASLQGLRIK